ncbi:MAG: hypothetical protein BWY19_00804 [bacterium ADurb.Bin212]|nr:MAG: hypothetical protein BWY19_00804 [bacterium ADurb.Bin212]
MKNFVQPGMVMPYTATAAVASGEAIEVVDLIGVATGAIANGEVGELLLSGVVELTKEAPLVINQGDKVYYDTTAKNVDKTNTNVFIGYAFESAISAATTVKVYLMQQGA